MKRLTLNQVARANIRVNLKAYISLFMGILVAVYLATATSLCAWGTIRGHEEQMAQQVGWLDMALMGNNGPTDEQLRRTGFFSGEIGHVTVNATVQDSEICTGYYDETAAKLMNRTMKEGRMPEKAGEAAAEESALIRLGLDKTTVGDTLTLTMEPVSGLSEERTFTLVGILNEQTSFLDTYNDEEGMRFPAILVSPEDNYDVGGTVVHRVLTYAPMITFNQVTRNYPGQLDNAYGISRETGGITWYDSGWDRAARIAERILVWAVLGAALMLSACVGITSSMESLLGRKTEDIGMLRAIGATRRQIRRIYGMEAWLLTATALPAGLLLGVLTAWIISRLAPGQVLFSLNGWLLFPILGLTALCVFIASRMPLYHASHQMPMGVLRDTALLRRAGRLRNHSTFRPDRLIAGRRTRLHPLRQLGAAGMVALTLVSTLLLGEVALGTHLADEDDLAAYRLYNNSAVYFYDPFSQVIPSVNQGREELKRLDDIDGVSSVRSITSLSVNLLLDEIPDYFRTVHYRYEDPEGGLVVNTYSALNGANGLISDWLFWSAEDLADARARKDEDWIASDNLQAYDQMEAVRAQLGIAQIPVPLAVYVIDPDPDALQEFVTEGIIDLQKMDSGEQVLVYAPSICARKNENGIEGNFYLYPSQIRDEEWDLVLRNDGAFTAGMPLNLLELAIGEGEGTEQAWADEPDWKAHYSGAETVRAKATVGAVLTGPVILNETYMYSCSLIVSSKGAEAMGLKLPNPEYTDVFLAGDPTPEQEERITENISQIALRSRTNVENRLQLNREYREKKIRQIALFSALILLFFAVSVFMQVSGAARQIRSETRMIGTLRAVGADLETLVGCYRLPVWISVAAAFIPCVLFYVITAMPGMRLFTANHPLIMIPVLVVLAVCVALACIAGIRGRLAGVARRSIVENIREL